MRAEVGFEEVENGNGSGGGGNDVEVVEVCQKGFFGLEVLERAVEGVAEKGGHEWVARFTTIPLVERVGGPGLGVPDIFGRGAVEGSC
jgi:hypothetical protein